MKTAELFHCRYAVLDGFVDVPEIPTKVLNVLEWPASLWVEPLLTLLDLFISAFLKEEVLSLEKNEN